MIDSTRPDSFQLSDYLGVLRRRWLTIVGLTVIGTLAAAAYIVVGPKAYTSTAVVQVTPNAANTTTLFGSKTATVVNMDNESAIVTSYSVARAAAKDMTGGLTPNQLLQQVSVVVPANTEILRISCSAPTPSGATSCAEAFANAYISVRQSTAAAKVQGEINTDTAREATLEAKSVKLQGELAGDKAGSAKAIAAHEQLANVGTQLSPLRTAIAGLGASNNFQAGYIITSANRPTSPSSPRKLLFGPSGVMVGLLIGLVLAFWADRRDDRIHAAQDVERFLDIPVLFALDHRASGLQAAVVPARSVTGREFTELARAIAAALGDGDHVLLVVGTSASSGASIVAANLAAALARIRAEVVLICADQQDSVAPALLGISAGGRGLAELIAGTATTAEVAQPSAVSRLRVITPGMDTDAVDDMQYYAGQRVVTALKQDARFVVIDAGTATAGRASGLAEFADGAIIVAEVNRTSRTEIADCARRLHRVRAEVLGAAVLPAGSGSQRAARRPQAGGPDPYPSRRDQPDLQGSGHGRRRPTGAPMMQAAPPDARTRSAGPQAARPGPITTEPTRRAKHGQPGDDRAPADPRVAGQTWPLPRFPGSDRPGSGPGPGYPDGYPAAQSSGDS
jgi:capsular polysaccharide biosynthesis protein